MKTRKRIAPWLLAVAMACVLVVLLVGPRRLVRGIDQHVPGEPLKEAWGSLYWKEDWATAPALDPRRIDATWLNVTRAGEVRVAHALGAAEDLQANTLPAMRAAIDHGFHFFEVDLWLDQAGVLRCFHGDDRGSQPDPFRPDDCTFEQVMEALPRDAWLILDIKSDFPRTGDEIVRRLGGDDARARHLIFQLYHPADFRSFVRWSQEITLASPIVTTYSAHRGIGHILSQLERLNVHAMTVPLDRLRVTRRSAALQLLLTHPVHDCQALQRARDGGARGFYTLTSLSC